MEKTIKMNKFLVCSTHYDVKNETSSFDSLLFCFIGDADIFN